MTGRNHSIKRTIITETQCESFFLFLYSFQVRYSKTIFLENGEEATMSKTNAQKGYSW